MEDLITIQKKQQRYYIIIFFHTTRTHCWNFRFHFNLFNSSFLFCCILFALDSWLMCIKYKSEQSNNPWTLRIRESFHKNATIQIFMSNPCYASLRTMLNPPNIKSLLCNMHMMYVYYAILCISIHNKHNVKIELKCAQANLYTFRE